MRMLARAMPFAVILAGVSIAASGQVDWKGSYYFGEDGGRNAGGIAMLISHELTIFDDGEGGLAARLESNGYQTSAELVCTAKPEGPKLLIYFQSYGENNMFEPYRPDDLLLTLEKKTEKGKTLVLTYWGKFTPAIPRNARSGKVYFEKTPGN